MTFPKKVRIQTGEVFDVNYIDQHTGKVGITIIGMHDISYDVEITKGFYEFIEEGEYDKQRNS